MDLHYQISTILLIFGYTLYGVGISSNAWKFEIGYHYGLLFRCDKKECVFYKVGYFGHDNLIRIGFLVSGILLAVSCICLFIEVAMVITRKNSTLKQRLGRTVLVSTFLAEIVASVCLGFFGYKALIGNSRLPSLGWGFGSTGGGVIALFLGSIVRTMGPSSSWSRIPCLKKKKRQRNDANGKQSKRAHKQKDKNRRKFESNNRPTKLHITQPADIITYRKASEPTDGSCENLLMVSCQDSTCSSPHHKYEEIHNRDFLWTQRGSQKLLSTSSNRPSPKLAREQAAKKSSSLPPGISPGFYAQVHRNPKFRTENNYEAPIVVNHVHQFQRTQSVPRYHPASPFRPIRVLTVDTSSIRSAPETSPPPSPPLPPPPPPLQSARMETVNIRRMNSTCSNGGNYKNNVVVDYAPSPSSLHSFGSYGN